MQFVCAGLVSKKSVISKARKNRKRKNQLKKSRSKGFSRRSYCESGESFWQNPLSE